MTGSPLTRTRCEIHADREAAARCIGCEQFFCRECITEHDGRMLCVRCLRKEAEPEEAPPPKRILPALGPFALILRFAIGFCVAWALFAFIGVIILKIPAEFHDGSIWSIENFIE